MHVLALDLSTTRTGWARWHPDMEAPRSGHIAFDASREGTRNREARDWMVRMIEGNGVDTVVRERMNFMSGDTNIAAIGSQIYLHGMVAEVCAGFGIPLHDLASPTWRKLFIGVSQAPKHVVKSRRRAWLKRAAIERCRELGLSPRSDDEAEALGVLTAFRMTLDHAFAVRSTPLLQGA